MTQSPTPAAGQETPRTDKFHDEHLGDCDDIGQCVLREQWYIFAKNLERELALRAAEERLKEAESRAAAAERNEKRYLWLRDEYTAKPFDERTALRGDTLDAAIDAATGGAK